MAGSLEATSLNNARLRAAKAASQSATREIEQAQQELEVTKNLLTERTHLHEPPK